MKNVIVVTMSVVPWMSLARSSCFLLAFFATAFCVFSICRCACAFSFCASAVVVSFFFVAAFALSEAVLALLAAESALSLALLSTSDWWLILSRMSV